MHAWPVAVCARALEASVFGSISWVASSRLRVFQTSAPPRCSRTDTAAVARHLLTDNDCCTFSHMCCLGWTWLGLTEKYPPLPQTGADSCLPPSRLFWLLPLAPLVFKTPIGERLPLFTLVFLVLLHCHSVSHFSSMWSVPQMTREVLNIESYRGRLPAFRGSASRTSKSEPLWFGEKQYVKETGRTNKTDERGYSILSLLH